MADRIDFVSDGRQLFGGGVRLTVEVDAIRRGISQYVQQEQLQLNEHIQHEIERLVTAEKFHEMISEAVRQAVTQELQHAVGQTARNAAKAALGDEKLRERVKAFAAKEAAKWVENDLKKAERGY